MQTLSTKWRVPPLAWPAIAAAIVAEATSNGLRAYALGAHLAAYDVTLAHLGKVSLAGGVLVLAAVAVSLSQSRAAWLALTPMAPARQRWLAGLAAALLLAVSVTAMASHILEAQRAKTGGESHERTAWALARTAYDKAKAESDRLGTGRTTDEVRRAMDAVRVPKWAWEDSAQCTKQDVRDDVARRCRPMLDLRKEMAAAISRADARRDLGAAQAALAALQPAPEAGSDETWLAGKWAWLMGLAVVVVATFGPVLFARVERQAANQSEFPTSSAVAGAELSNRKGLLTSSMDGAASEPSNRSETPATRANGSVRNGGFGGVRMAKEQALQALLTELALGRGFGSQDELAERFGRPKSTVSEWLTEWTGAGLIPARRSVGRRKAMIAA